MSNQDTTVPERGFIYVASVNRLYYELAINSCTTLKDYYPDAHVTLFTHEKFLDDRVKGLFDNIVTNIPIHVRAKMWGMARTPYDKTIYIDCDSIIAHRDIKKMHGFLDECDMFCGDVADYTVADIRYAHVDRKCEYKAMHHGSMWGYNKTSLTIDFMQTWFDKFVQQKEAPTWEFDDFAYPVWQQFDMFTLWRLITNHFNEGFDRFQDLNIRILPSRWNSSGQVLRHHVDGPKVIVQIDRNTFSKTSSSWWAEVMRRATDVQHTVDRTKATKSSYEHN